MYRTKSSEKWLIVGYSDFSKEIKWILDRNNYEAKFIGFVAKDTSEDIWGNDEDLINVTEAINVVIAIGNPEIRQALYEKYKVNPNIIFPNVIDSKAIVSKDVEIGIGNIFCAGTIVTTGVNIGNFNIINLNSTIGHNCIIKDYVTINPGSNISGNVELESMVQIGTGTKIIQQIHIKESSIIGAGAVVISDIPSNSTAVGVPAKVVKKRE